MSKYKMNQMAFDTWKGKYKFNEEKSPDDMHHRLAKEFARIRYTKDKSKDEKNWETYFYSLFKDFKYIIPQGSVMANLGTNTPTSLSNCFRGNVKVLTRQGWKNIEELEDKEIEIMTKGGGWTKAPFKSYGKQQLYKIVLSNGYQEKEIHATKDHRWVIFKKHSPKDTSKVITTSNLEKGHKLYSTYGKYRGWIPSSIGKAHGITYGDGHTVKGRDNCNNITLCGDSRVLGKYFSESFVSSNENNCEGGSDFYSRLPNYFRELPNIEENKSYLYGWLAGYFAADGHIDERGSVMIDSSKKYDLIKVQDICGVLGIGCSDITKQTVISNLTNKEHTMYKVVIHKNHLSPNFFLLEKHRNRFFNTNKQPARWVVKEVIKTNKVEKVYCAEVPKTESFVIEGNILSMNCFVIGQPHDSYGGIFYKDQEMAQLMKRRGGVGIDISSLRPNGVETSNAAKTSTGAASFMHRFSNTTREVAQEGRRGALMITIDIRHPDIEEFINMKKDRSLVTGANISVMLREDFMKAVENDEDYVLRWPCDQKLHGDEIKEYYLSYNELFQFDTNSYVKRIKAKQLYEKIVENAHAHAEPGQIFVDRHWDFSPDGVYPQYRGITTNPCFIGNMKLLTENGYKTFKSLCNTQTCIIDSEGKKQIASIFSNGKKEIVEISFYGKPSIFCTPDHEFRDVEGFTVKARDLKGKRIMPYYYINKEVDLYTKLGFIQGDGNLTRLNSLTHKGIEINLGENDFDIKELFGYEGNGRKYYTTEYTKILKKLRFDAEILSKRTFPLTFDSWTRKQKVSFLKGLFSANGSVISGKRIAFKSTSIQLIRKLEKVLYDIGIESYITTNKKKIVKFSNGNYICRESYDLNIGKRNDIIKFAMYIGFIHKYKQLSLEELIKLKAPLVSNVYNRNAQEVYDFSIENSANRWGVVEGVIAHNCGEIFMGTYDACRLICINLYNIVDNPFTDKAKINYELLYEIAYEQQLLADDLVDLEIEHINKIIKKIKTDPEPNEVKSIELRLWQQIKSVASAGRRTGCGFTALGDMLAALGLKYDSDEAMSVTEAVMKMKMKGELSATINLAIDHGPFYGWDAEKEFTYYDELLGRNEFFHFITEQFPEEAMKMYKYGRRNISWSTVAPTGSVSILAQTTSGIEPLFQPWYTRRKKINPNDIDVRVDFVDQSGDSWQEYFILHPKFKDWLYLQHKSLEIPRLGINGSELVSPEEWEEEILIEAFKYSPWYKSIAADIDWKKRINLQAIVQKYTTHSISSTLNLPKETTKEQVSNIYMEAWKAGLKGVTIYREGSRSGVLINKESFPDSHAPKRPKKISAISYNTSVKGEAFTVVVGMMEEKPYEVFAYRGKGHQGEGFLLKKKSGHYVFENGEEFDITDTLTDEEETITRMASGVLRHSGGQVKFVVDTLNKTKGDLTSFGKAIARVLKRHVKDGELSTEGCPECESKLIFEEGCQKCLSCGFSKC